VSVTVRFWTAVELVVDEPGVDVEDDATVVDEVDEEDDVEEAAAPEVPVVCGRVVEVEVPVPWFPPLEQPARSAAPRQEPMTMTASARFITIASSAASMVAGAPGVHPVRAGSVAPSGAAPDSAERDRLDWIPMPPVVP
jgi:hypothetical protein